MTQTIHDLTTNRNLWEEYVDPDDNAPFDNLTVEEREALIRETWPNDFDDEGNAIC